MKLKRFVDQKLSTNNYLLIVSVLNSLFFAKMGDFACASCRVNGESICGEVGVICIILGAFMFCALERILSKYPKLHKLSPVTTLHEVAHLLAARLLGVKATWRCGRHYVRLGWKRTPTQNSIITLAPISVLIFGITLANIVMLLNMEFPLRLLAMTLVFVIGYSGFPSEKPNQAGDCPDWRQAIRFGNWKVNLCWSILVFLLPFLATVTISYLVII